MVHLIGNMLFLWVFGDNIEDARARSLSAFYLLCGAAGGMRLLRFAAVEHPLVGASAAVAGVIAAYLMLRPCAKITVLLRRDSRSASRPTGCSACSW